MTEMYIMESTKGNMLSGSSYTMLLDCCRFFKSHITDWERAESQITTPHRSKDQMLTVWKSTNGDQLDRKCVETGTRNTKQTSAVRNTKRRPTRHAHIVPQTRNRSKHPQDTTTGRMASRLIKQNGLCSCNESIRR